MTLSQRQLEVLRGLLNGKSNEQIGQSLGISINTVRNHNHSIYRYLGISEREQLILMKLRVEGFVKAKRAGA